MKSCVLLAVAVLVASVASAQTSGVQPPPVGQVTTQEISVVTGGIMTFEKDVVWKSGGVALRANAEEKTEYRETSEPHRSVPSSLRDSLAHVRYEPLSVTSTAAQDPRHDWSCLPHGRAVGAAGQVAASPSMDPNPRGAKVFLGVVGGLVGGLLVGAFIDKTFLPCHCEDPGLRGAMIGAPVGAILGGTLVWEWTK